MSKIEVGEYVRFDDGQIKLVTQELKDFIDEHESLTEKDLVEFLGKIKHSKQPIDLIKVGDIIEIKTELCNSFKCFVENEDDLLLLEEKVKQFWNIKKILTKEQFEANCYKVGGKEWA